MAISVIAGRSSSTLMRAIWRATCATKSASRAQTRVSLSPSMPSQVRPNLTLRQSRTYPSSPRFVRRELSSFQPFHSATASAFLVSKLPSEASPSTEGRFANYISPI